MNAIAVFCCLSNNCSELSDRVSDIGRIAQGTLGHCPGHPAQLCIILQPDIAAALTSNDSAACQVGPAFPAYIDDDFSIARADLQRDEAAVALGITTAESADIAAHCALLSCKLRRLPWHQTCHGLQIKIANYFREISRLQGGWRLVEACRFGWGGKIDQNIKRLAATAISGW